MIPIIMIVTPADDKNSDDNEGRPTKRDRPTGNRALGGAESTKRTRRSPATRTRKEIKSRSKAAGRGAERLASTKARGLYSRPLTGLRVPQGSVGALELEQPSWIEERDVVETWNDTGSSVPQQTVQEHTEDQEDLHKIPGKLSQRERLMLQMTQAEEECGGVRVIRCKLCPETAFSTWIIFQRHCRSCEKHPSALEYCPTCGDPFARSDSKDRHKDKKHQEACQKTPQEEADMKKEKVERLLKAFEGKLTHCLKNGLDIKHLFSDVVAPILTNTSKKVSKTVEISLKGDPWFAGLL
jgi:hypothetical protein